MLNGVLWNITHSAAFKFNGNSCGDGKNTTQPLKNNLYSSTLPFRLNA